MQHEHAMLTPLRRLLRRVLRRSTEPTLNTVVHSTMPAMDEAEMDRYIHYHRSNQHGR